MTAAKWIVPLMMLAFVGCATGPAVTLATPDSDAAAKQFKPPEGKANLYVARSGGSDSRVTSFDIAVDGKSIGPIGPGTFYLVSVDPGRHTVAAASVLNSAKTTFDAEAGRNYFYEVTASGSGFSAQPNLGMVVIEEMGKIMVRQNRLAQGAGE